MTIERPANHGKVGLITIIDHTNYGNRLQNYAMQRIITDLGFACTTIVNSPDAQPESRREPASTRPRSPLRRLLAGTPVARLGRRLLKGGQRDDVQRLKDERRATGRAFSRANIRESDFTLYRDTPAGHLDAMYDHFVVGSDQVWNPEFRKLSEVDFLTFASRPKRIAFSASIGIPDIPDEHRAFYRARLSEFAHISVREEAAAGVVHALTGRQVPVTIDPTLMLRREVWAGLAKAHPKRPAGDYLATYWLGPRSDTCRELTDRCAARRRLPVVHLNDRAVAKFYAADPAEFLGVIKDARLLVTNSFHGVIFSVIFGTPFVSFRRDYRFDMGSRLDTLLATLGLEHRRFREGLSDAELDRLLEPDFVHVQPILDRKTAEARVYLARALGREGPLAEPTGGAVAALAKG